MNLSRASRTFSNASKLLADHLNIAQQASPGLRLAFALLLPMLPQTVFAAQDQDAQSSAPTFASSALHPADC